MATKRKTLTEAEERQLKALSRSGKRLMGFSRTNLFKRLQSGRPAFIQSIDRHILRNYIFLHAIEQALDLPIGTQEAALLDSRNNDEDPESILATLLDPEGDFTPEAVLDQAESDYRQRAAQVYRLYATRYQRRFKWIQPGLLKPSLKKDLQADAKALTAVLTQHGKWLAPQDPKLAALVELLTQKHSGEKVLVFTQFADTVRYLSEELQRIGLTHIAGVTGNLENPAAIAWRFSPRSNGKSVPEDELRVFIKP